ncbi:histidine phosphatase family protein [Actinomycetaceae bacterium MB13-C1-2]|nr:histidine phosphatase family protein [Actinomycetaceae bacterium MB13-C1-2]
MRLFLVRHGQTTANVAGALDTALPGAELTDLGWQQAATLPERFEDVEIAHMAISDRTRTAQTASYLAKAINLDPVIDPDLREIGAGSLEMNTDIPSVRAYRSRVLEWSHGNLDEVMPGGESGHQVIDRFDRAIQRAHERADTPGALVIVAHGAIIRTWSRLRAGVTDLEEYPYVDNAGIVEMTDDEGTWQIKNWMKR